MIPLTLILKLTTAQVVKTSVTVNDSAIQDYVHPDDHAPPTYVIMPPGFTIPCHFSYVMYVIYTTAAKTVQLLIFII